METSNLVYERLTRRESDILFLLTQKLSDQEIAERLVLSPHTVKWYTRQIYSKLGVGNRRAAAARAQALGLFRQEAPEKRPGLILPRQISSFIGREKEIDEVVRLVWDHPLVTLTGAGGVGKTRLAQAAAAELVDDISDGIWYVELAALADPQLVLFAVANVLGIQVEPGKLLIDLIYSYFHDRQVLLVLDNCEHLVQACAEMVHALLTHLPLMKILVTSRELLSVSGEVIYRVPSLSLPPDENSPEIERYESVRLFLERAKEHQTDFHLSEDQAAVLARICRRLDGIPLAIELAAARTRSLSLEQISSRLENAFSLLTSGSRSALPRHKSLRACIDLSFEMLSPAEQLLLARLSVFSGGWTLEAAEIICADDPAKEGEKPGLHDEPIINLLGGLVDKSLIQFQPSPSEASRYRMLETVRQYAHNRLVEYGEFNRISSQHLTYYTHLVNSVFQFQEEMEQWIHSVTGNFDNIRLALGWALANDPCAGLQLCISTIYFLPTYYTPEFYFWIERLLAGEAAEIEGRDNQVRDPARLILRGSALNAILHWGVYWGQRERAMQAAMESKSIFEGMGEPGEEYLASTLAGLGLLTLVSDPDQSRVYLETSLAYIERHEDPSARTNYLKMLGNVFAYQGNWNQSRRCFEEALHFSRKNELFGEEAMLLMMLGWIESLQSKTDLALDLLIQSQTAYGKTYEYDYIAGCFYERALLAWAQGDDATVVRLCAEMTQYGEQTDCKVFDMNCEEMLARREWAFGENAQAIQRAEAALIIYRPIQFNYADSLAYVIGRAALAMGQIGKAARYFRTFDDSADAPRWRRKAYSLHCFGLLAAAQIEQQAEQAERAAILFGAQDVLFGWLPQSFAPIEQREYEQALAVVRDALGEEAFAAAWERGKTMPRKEVFAYAVDGI